MTRATFVSVSLAAWLALFGAARAQGAPPSTPIIDPIDIPPEHDPLAHAFDRPGERGGFYTRLVLSLTGYHDTGLGPASWENEYGGVEAHGFGSGFGLDAGGVVAPWLVLHLTGHVGVLWDGELEQEFGIAGALPTSARVSAYGLAPAATFITPYDFFFTTGFGVGIAHIKYSGHAETTKPGFFMDLVAGKDLYVGRNFAFGIQMQIVYMKLGADEKEDEARVRQYLFGFSFAFDSI